MVCAAVTTASRRHTIPLDVCPDRPSTATIDFPAEFVISDNSVENCCHIVVICISCG
jgi:hypothetical protein